MVSRFPVRGAICRWRPSFFLRRNRCRIDGRLRWREDFSKMRCRASDLVRFLLMPQVYRPVCIQSRSNLSFFKTRVFTRRSGAINPCRNTLDRAVQREKRNAYTPPLVRWLLDAQAAWVSSSLPSISPAGAVGLSSVIGSGRTSNSPFSRTSSKWTETRAETPDSCIVTP